VCVYVALFCTVMQYVAGRCSVLQCVAVCCEPLNILGSRLHGENRAFLVCCNVLHYVAAFQRVAAC